MYFLRGIEAYTLGYAHFDILYCAINMWRAMLNYEINFRQKLLLSSRLMRDYCSWDF